MNLELDVNKMNIYRHDIEERVIYNTDNTESNMVVEDDYTSRHTLFGAFNFTTSKQIRQSTLNNKKSTSVGFK